MKQNCFVPSLLNAKNCATNNRAKGQSFLEKTFLHLFCPYQQLSASKWMMASRSVCCYTFTHKGKKDFCGKQDLSNMYSAALLCFRKVGSQWLLSSAQHSRRATSFLMHQSCAMARDCFMVLRENQKYFWLLFPKTFRTGFQECLLLTATLWIALVMGFLPQDSESFCDCLWYLAMHDRCDRCLLVHTPTY